MNKNQIINNKRKIINNRNKSIIKTFIKKINFFIKNNKKNECLILFKKLQSNLDRSARKRIIHRNKSARIKSRIIKKINFL